MQKSFNERLSEWRRNHPITQEEMDAIDSKRSVEKADEILVGCVPASLDINGYPEETAFQKWANEISISKEEADEIYRKRDPARASEFFADCDPKSVDRNGGSGDMTHEKIQEMFSDRKRFTPDSFKSGWMADLPDEDKEFLMHGDCDPEEFFADCDADSIDCSNEHTLYGKEKVDE